MTLSRGNYAFDLFLQLTRVCQVYLYTILCMFSTCHPCSYDQESIDYVKRLDHQFEGLFGDFDFKKTILKQIDKENAAIENIVDQDLNNLTTAQIDLFQEVAEYRLNSVGLKESMTVIANYIDTHLAEEARVYEFGHERYMNIE